MFGPQRQPVPKRWEYIGLKFEEINEKRSNKNRIDENAVYRQRDHRIHAAVVDDTESISKRRKQSIIADEKSLFFLLYTVHANFACTVIVVFFKENEKI